MSGGRPVARVLATPISHIVTLVVLLAAVAVSGVVAVNLSVDTLVEEVQPAAVANKDVLQDLSDMQAAVRVWARTGDSGAVAAYREAEARLPEHQEEVRRVSRGDAELAELVDRQAVLAQTWVTESAAPRLELPGGPTSVYPRRFQVSERQFADFRGAHAETMAAFADRVDSAKAQADLWLRGTVVGILVVAGLLALVVLRTRRRLHDEVTRPLRRLERAVQLMAAPDTDLRAPESGPREIRAVAAALNRLADAQGLARDVESRIHEELRSLDTAKDDFVSNVSHELRTPLTTISGYLELVAEEFDGRIPQRHQKMMDATRRNVARLRLLIDDLLTLSRAERPDTDVETVDMAVLVREVVTDVRSAAARRSITIDTSLPDERLLVLGDRVMLQRALANLVGNAVKFSRDRGSVEVGVSRLGTSLCVVVRDHGIGIPSDELDRLGTRFFRASNAVRNEIAGTGLGVRIVQAIVDKHDGELVVESEEGAGTTVTLRLLAQARPQLVQEPARLHLAP